MNTINDDQEITNYRSIVNNPLLCHRNWLDLKNNNAVLNHCMTLETKENKSVLFSKLICEKILTNPYSVDSEIYCNLINVIFSNRDVADEKLDGSSFITFIFVALFDNNVILNPEQKKFAEKIALEKFNAKNFNYKKNKNAGTEQLYAIFNSSTNTAGVGEFDIRYAILLNDSWTNEEKGSLINDFWVEQNEYENALNSWEILVQKTLFDNSLDKEYKRYNIEELYELDPQIFDQIFDSNLTKKTFIRNIDLCRLMHKVRPTKKDILSENKKGMTI